ncbi:MAG: hypothetical protein OXC62_10280 [Aestuariivita sp.]|nr:hypothetical protein [Aestuariivita sp.]
MRSGRRRWAIENETFQTLKEGTGDRFEHNDGHGKKHLANVLMTFADSSFLIDQVLLHCGAVFQRARDDQKCHLYL